MSKVYVIVDVGLEYNDEYYTVAQNDAGTPIVAYRSEAKAAAMCLEQNIAALGNHTPSDFDWGDSMLAVDEEAARTALRALGYDLEDSDGAEEFELLDPPKEMKKAIQFWSLFNAPTLAVVRAVDLPDDRSKNGGQ